MRETIWLFVSFTIYPLFSFTYSKSNSLVFSERCIFSPSSGNQTRVGYVMTPDGSVIISQGTQIATANGKDFMRCYDSTYRAGNEIKSPYATGVDVNNVDGAPGLSGLRWADGLPAYTTFNTIMPPNSPSCTRQNGENQAGLMAPSSYHPLGVQAALYDGSVRFIMDTINFGNLSLMPIESGPSPYGVWGALGSISGGENVTTF